MLSDFEFLTPIFNIAKSLAKKANDLTKNKFLSICLVMLAPIVLQFFGALWSMVSQYFELIMYNPLAGLLPFSRAFFWPEKIFVIIWYIMMMGVLGVWAAFCWFIVNFFDIDAIGRRNMIVQYIVERAWLRWPYLFVLASSTLLPAFFSLAWLPFIGLIIAWLGFLMVWVPAIIYLQRIRKWVLAALVLAAVAQVAQIYGPLLIGRPFIINDNIDLPEETILRDVNGETRVIDNTAYLNEHLNILGMPRHDPRKMRTQEIRMIPGLKIDQTQNLKDFLLIQEHHMSVNIIKGGPISNKWKDFAMSYTYDQEEGMLRATNFISGESANALEMLLPFSKHDEIRAYVLRNNAFFASHSPGMLDYTDGLMYRYNVFEWAWQAQNRFFFHHNNFLLGPINECELGRPHSEINSQYGGLMIFVVSSIMKTIGGIDMASYIRTLHLFIPLYLILGILFLAILLGNWEFAILGLGVYAALTSVWEPQYIHIVPPGANPIRHFLDFPVAICLIWHLRKKDFLSLVAISLMCATSICLNPMFGLFLTCASFITLNLAWLPVPLSSFNWKLCASRNFLFLAFWALAMAANRAMSFKDCLTKYYLLGANGIPLNYTLLSIAIGLVFISYYMLILFWKTLPEKIRILSFFMLTYGQGCMIYYVWSSDIGHFLVVIPFVLIAFLILICFFCQRNKTLTDIFVTFLAVNLLLAIAGGIFGYEIRYAMTFGSTKAHHVLHSWDNPRAGIVTTTPEDLLNEACSMIKRNSSANGIHIFSKYDTFLPFLAGKYSAMRYPDLQWFILSSKEADNIVEQIKTERPRVIFADSDLERDKHADVIRINEYCQKETTLRAMRLNYVNKVFNRIKDDYELTEQGHLLNVWTRKAGR